MSSQKEAEHEVLFKKVVQAREAAGFSLKEAATLLEFNNYQTLSSIEKGERNLNAHELNLMARIYSRNLDFFFEPNVAPDPIPLWRKTTESNAQNIQRQFLSFLENYSNIENLLNLKRRWIDIQKKLDKADFFDRGFKLVDQISDEISLSLNLGSRPAFNLFNILENDFRIKIIHLDLPNGISGACVVNDVLGVGILINKNEAPWRRNYDLAHELFHVVTWNVFTHEEVGDGTQKTKPEQYANVFASSLLLPERPLKNALEEIVTDEKIRIVDTVELAKDFGVSTEAVLWRLVNLNILKKIEVEKVIADPDFRKIDRERRKGLYYENIPNKFPSRYVSLTCRCLMEEKISRGVFSEYMEINRPEIDTFLRGAGFMEKNYEKIAST